MILSILWLSSKLMMQEHRQQQASVGQTPFHFWHMLKMFELF
jgi:hypothetical protein